jgi:chromosome segregation ATPase
METESLRSQIDSLSQKLQNSDDKLHILFNDHNNLILSLAGYKSNETKNHTSLSHLQQTIDSLQADQNKHKERENALLVELETLKDGKKDVEMLNLDLVEARRGLMEYSDDLKMELEEVKAKHELGNFYFRSCYP